MLLTDLRLPDLDGRELARSVRQFGSVRLILMITGWDLDPDQSHEAWGIDHVFTKPVDLAVLVARIDASADLGNPPSEC